MVSIAYDPALGVFSNSYECPGIVPMYKTARMYSEAAPTSSLLRRVWGYFQTGVAAGIIPMVLNMVDAKALAARAFAEKWTPGKCISEVRKAAHAAKKAPRIIGTVTGVFTGVIEGVIYGGAAAVAGATAGTAVMVGAGVFLACLLVCSLLGWTIGSIFAKRGFIRVMEGYLGKKLMHAVNAGGEEEYPDKSDKQEGKEKLA